MVVSRQSENDCHGVRYGNRICRDGAGSQEFPGRHRRVVPCNGARGQNKPGRGRQQRVGYRLPPANVATNQTKAERRKRSCSPVAQIHPRNYPSRRIRSCGRRVTTGHKGDGGRSLFSRFLAAASTHRHAFRLTPSRRLKCDPHRISAHDKPPMLHNEIDHAAIHTQGCTCRG
jgi:hypothetical protein